MDNNFDIFLNQAIKTCEIDSVSPFHFYRIYPFTTENINGYIDLFNLKDKSLLTVGSSCDQVLNAIALGCYDITLVDICPFTKFYYYLKVSAIICLDKDEFIKFFKYSDYPEVFKDNKYVFDNKVFQDIKSTLRLLDYESYLFWDELFQTFEGNVIRTRLFQDDEYRDYVVCLCNKYLSNELYDKTKLKVKKVIPNFINGNLKKIALPKTYDNIWLSNIGTYLTLYGLNRLVCKLDYYLNEDGKMLISYLYDDVKNSTYKDDYSPIYDFIKACRVLERFSPDVETFTGVSGLKFSTDAIKDSVLTYTKHK